MGFEPTTLRDLVGCSNHWATGDSMVSKGQFVGLDWNRITRLHSQVMTGTHKLTNSITLSHNKYYSLQRPMQKSSGIRCSLRKRRDASGLL